jgi:Mg-chelatase subunit ChlD
MTDNRRSRSVVVVGVKQRRRVAWVIPLLTLIAAPLVLWQFRERPVSLPQPMAPRTVGALDLILIIDDSGSNYGDEGTDPAAIRYKGARQLVSILGAEGFGYDDRVAVVKFGTEATSTDLVPATDASVAAHLVASDPDLGNTNVAEALTRAAKVFAESTPKANHKRVVIMFTDGVPSDSQAKILEAAKTLGNADLTIVLHNEERSLRKAFESNRHFWKTNNANVVLLSHLTGGSAERAFAVTAYRLLGISTIH